MADGYGTPTGDCHIYIRCSEKWTYAGCPLPYELESTIAQYQRQYGKENVRISNSPNEEAPATRPCTSKQQSHANIRSAFKQITNVEKDWAYRSKTMLKDSKWRR